ncbi:hypothetical protein HUW51_15360 [Adhaeribacter swui]|uniref:Uncharacterized protein n=1 Tax=Adhaeribacter swui TaxID=2086471 RepID=A0A7G7GA47_9BACT|nr:hypothetical protein [Adhaeribacter swui]QNF34031.1 hypothetical protein HUW51_15360 [Adhaeribacter swui]
MGQNKSITLVLALIIKALFSFTQYEQAVSKETMTFIVSGQRKNMIINISTPEAAAALGKNE